MNRSTRGPQQKRAPTATRTARPIAEYSAAQRTRILRAMRSHAEGADAVKGRSAVLLVEPHVAARGAAPLALVAMYDYERDRTVVATVDPVHGRVKSLEETPVAFQLSDAERKDAEALAKADARVKQFLGRAPMRPITRLYFPPDGSPHRYAIVFIRPNSSQRRYAVVDLSARRVSEVLSRADLAG